MTYERNPPPSLSRAERPRLREEAATIVGFDLGTRPEYGSAGNVSGVRTRDYTYSRRLDSRTIFARDERYGPGRPEGAWTGAKRPCVASCRRVLRAAGVPRREIDEVEVVTEFGRVAKRDGEEALGGRPDSLRRLAIAGRAVDGAAVWSSYCSVALTAKGAIGEVELHWPVIPSAVLDEARALGEYVAPSFTPEPLSGAVVESIEVGVLHSPAIAFFMDTVAAIRVVYQATREGEGGTGRKAVTYVDRHGERVELPRDIKATRPETDSRPSPEG